MEHEKKEHEGKRHHMDGKHHKGSMKAQMTKKETGFGAKLGKHHGKGGLEGPHEGMKK